MILDKENLFDRIRSHSFEGHPFLATKEKVRALDEVITKSVKQACTKIVEELGRVHLAYSGGVDSSVVLTKMVAAKFPVTVHTMVKKEDHPDLVHAKCFVKLLREKDADVEHEVHLLTPSNHDTQESNRLLERVDDYPDNYYLLMKVLQPRTSHIICCDCIDELLGGYHMHCNPREFFPLYTEEKDLSSNRFAVLSYYMSRLIPDHLFMLDTFSNHFGITVHLPYGSK